MCHNVTFNGCISKLAFIPAVKLQTGDIGFFISYLEQFLPPFILYEEFP